MPATLDPTRKANADFFKEQDDAFRKRFAVHNAAQESRAMGEPGQSMNSLRENLRKVEAAQEQYNALTASMAQLDAKIDAAVAADAEATLPLRRELEDSATPTDRRIAARVALNELTAKLEATIAELTKSKTAAEQERAVVTPMMSARQVIENAAVFAGSDEEQERMRVLETSANAVEVHVLPIWQHKAESAELSLQRAQEKQEQMNPRHRLPLDDLERKARIARSVCNQLAKWKHEAERARDEIRRQLIREMYAE